MSQDINMTEELTKRRDSAVSYFVISSIVQWEKLTGKKWNYSGGISFEGDKNLKVEFSIDGIEMPFEKFLTAYYSQMEYHINKRARELVEERAGDLYCKFNTIADQMRDKLCQEFGFTFDEE